MDYLEELKEEELTAGINSADLPGEENERLKNGLRKAKEESARHFDYYIKERDRFKHFRDALENMLSLCGKE